MRLRWFFHVYGERSGVMWQAFGAAVVEFAAACGSQGKVVCSAILTFRTLRQWCEGRPSHA